MADAAREVDMLDQLVRVVTRPRCEKCAKGKHLKCEHPDFVERRPHDCCCVVRKEADHG